MVNVLLGSISLLLICKAIRNLVETVCQLQFFKIDKNNYDEERAVTNDGVKDADEELSSWWLTDEKASGGEDNAQGNQGRI